MVTLGESFIAGLPMSVENHFSSSDYLPARAPDLVVSNGPGGKWFIQALSAPLAALTGSTVQKMQGRELARLFAGVVPPLDDLAKEVQESDRPLTDLLIHFPFRGGLTLAAEVHPGGLTEDYSGRTVMFLLREPTAREVKEPHTRHGLVGTSAAIREVFRKIALYGPADAAVVITGETGTGKELVARALHEASARQRGPFVAVNCSAISEELLESELFGHEKGAFTGAVRSHRGRFERADGGTLFLDEIGDMPFHTQAKLLRTLEEGSIERVGGEAEKRVDVRVVAATNVVLEKAVGQGRFRADLYHRLSVLRIHLPSLRERPEDIPPLVDHFLDAFSRKYGRRIRRLTPEALSLLQAYLWPGNVRELRNVLERVFIETQAEVIGARAFREWIRERQDFAPGDWGTEAAGSRPQRTLLPPYPLATERHLLPAAPSFDVEVLPPIRRSTRPVELDADEIRKAYRTAGGNLAAAARLLGVHRATLYRYMEKLGLHRDNMVEEN
jgi:DNA-binding NtrC family response regulator